MGKRKESGTEEELIIDSPPGSLHKKHKKHKKKHKKKKDGDLDELSPKPPITLKLKIGGETLSTKSVQSMKKEPSSDDSGDQIIDVLNVMVVQEKEEDKTKKDDTSDEEKEWLDALEAGNLDDSGMLKKHGDSKPLTARQRALVHGQQEEELLQLPSGYRQVELTEEQVLKRQQRAKKRRQQAHEKREKDKKQTLERLLKKQESKNKNMRVKGSKKSNAPKVHYVNNQNGISISVPQGIQFPFVAEKAIPPKPKTLCGVKGCSNPKKYSCSKTLVPLCSLQCYKINMSVSHIKTEVLAT